MESNSSKGYKATTTETALLHDNTVSPRDDRKIRGKMFRDLVPHQAHANWKAPSNRPDPIDLLEQSNRGRIPDLIPLRYGRMLQSPFTFYRGSAALMAYDLATTPNSSVRVQACGDCHLLNFGAFATPERNIVFDINDFDETLPAPWEWDLKRLAVSFVLTAQDNGLKQKTQQESAETVARSYRENITEYAKMSIMDIWYSRVDWGNVIEKTSNIQLQKRRVKDLNKEKNRTIQSHYFPKLTQHLDGHYAFKENPPTLYHLTVKNEQSFQDSVRKSMGLYRDTLRDDIQRLFDRYRLTDLAMKVVGIGSVGTVCSVALMLAPDDDPLILQIKEARPSVLESYAGTSTFNNHGQRVVAGQRIVQSASDIFLGWTKFDNGKHFYVRQLRDTKLKPEPDLWDGDDLIEMAQIMGNVLARAHARSGDSAVIRGYLGTRSTFDEAIASFALAYADQTEKDHAALVKAVRSGRIKATIEEEGQ